MQTIGMHTVTSEPIAPCFCSVHAVHGGRYTVCKRIENKDLLYPHIHIGDATAMQALIEAMEGHRASLQQKVLTAPIAMQLEDETVEDNADDPDDDADMEEGPPDGSCANVVDAPDETRAPIQTEDASPIPHPEAPPLDGDDTATIPLDLNSVNTSIADRTAMPPPQPRPRSRVAMELPAFTDTSSVAPDATRVNPPPTNAPPSEPSAIGATTTIPEGHEQSGKVCFLSGCGRHGT